ncbi:hypothetical protein Q1695_011569 [Nippostrongylus brasiliensis]|nr:hypothetical protein Q1695_011569 [Nippostrongylus brasiliensis]
MMECKVPIIKRNFQPPQIGTQIMVAKLNKTGLFAAKRDELLKPLTDSTLSVQEQRNRMKTYISKLGNAKVKQATQKVFDEMQRAQDTAWMALNKTNEALTPLLGPAMTQVQMTLDQTCKELQGNYTSCLPRVMRRIALQTVPVAGKNKTKTAFNTLLQWEGKEKKRVDEMRKFFT